jgi:hypothetical protein
LMWVEIRLGRVPQSLAVWRYLTSMAEQMEMEDSDRADLQEDFRTLDQGLGYLFIKANPSQLPSLQKLPDPLGNLNLDMARMLLLWSLGQEARVRQDYLPADEQDYDLDALFRRTRV